MTLAAKPIHFTTGIVRHATRADLEAILVLERAIPTAPHWPAATYAAILEGRRVDEQTTNPQRCLFVAEQHATIVGFASGLTHPANPGSHSEGELETIAVAASARRAGVGRALCTAVVGWCREQGATSMLLEVRATSAAAIALYTALGFAPQGCRPRYYSDPEDDALILRLPSRDAL